MPRRTDGNQTGVHADARSGDEERRDSICSDRCVRHLNINYIWRDAVQPDYGDREGRRRLTEHESVGEERSEGNE